MKHNYLIFFLLIFSLTGFAQTLEDDRLALLAFYNTTNGPGWTNKSGWTSPGNAGDNPCGWFGDTCENGRVTALNLANNRFQGTIPAQIGNLTALKSLNLTGGSNGIYTETWLNGALPSELGNLVNLEILDIGKNHFTGAVPSSLGNLILLKRLDLSFVPFDAGFDQFGQLSGSIPIEFEKLSNLEYLDLSLQNLSGDIPTQLGNLTGMKTLNLRSNIFTGSIPATFTNLTNLIFLDLGFDYFPTRGKEHGSLGGKIPDLSGIPISAFVDISGNSFTFNGIESNISRLVNYSGQAKLRMAGNFALSSSSGQAGELFVEAGGTLAKNTYRWYKDNVLVATEVGKKEFFADKLGKYRVEVTNSIATQLTLISDDYNVGFFPVTMISFSGKNHLHTNELTWKTTSETNNKGFEIEKSGDARSFEKIGFVDGSGDFKGNKTYTFKDRNPHFTTYYRLKQIDYDSKFEYSRIISVKQDLSEISIYPNPADNHLFVKNLGKEESITMRNSTGQIILHQKLLPNEPINTMRFSNGLYTLTIGEETRKFVIQK